MERKIKKIRRVILASLFLFAIVIIPTISFSASGTIYIDTYGDGIPKISGSHVWPDSYTIWDENQGAWFLYMSVSGAHRIWAESPSRFVLTDLNTNEISIALHINYVQYSNLYSWSWYQGYLYGLDKDGNHIEPNVNWDSYIYGSDVNDGSYKLAYKNLITDLVNYDIYLRGTGVSTSQPGPDPEPDYFGTTLQTAPNHDFFVEQNAQTTESIYLYNPGSEERTATLEILNPYQELNISLQNQEITVGPRATQTVSAIIIANSTPIGIYEDLLLKISVDDGEILYSNIKVTIVAPDAGPVPDLSVRSDDIGLDDDTVTLSATIQNKGLASASNVEVKFFDLFGNSLGSITLDEIPSKGLKTASITTTFTAGEHLVRVVIDPDNKINEIDKSNNEASTVIRVGTGEPLSGNILVTGSLPSNVYTGSLFTISGRAVYDIYQGGTRYTNYAVKGGSVQITIRNSDGTEWVYGGIYTNVDGYFSKRLQAPSNEGTYELVMKVTDSTFTGSRELNFSVTERDPYTPPPSPPNTTGSGEWSYVNGTWI